MPYNPIGESSSAPKTGGYNPIGSSPHAAAAPAPVVSPYFSTTTANGSAFGPSKQLDPSGRPLLDYRKPGDTATTTDLTRVDTKFDPTVAQPVSKDARYNPRDAAGEAQQRIIQGSGPNDQIDHRMALAVSGSNNPANLKSIPSAENQKDGSYEYYLADQVSSGKMSLFQAQTLEAKNKDLPTPFTGQAKDPSFWDELTGALRSGASGVGRFILKTLDTPKAEAAGYNPIQKDALSSVYNPIAKTPPIQYSDPLGLNKPAATAQTTPQTTDQPDAATSVFNFFFKQVPITLQPTGTKPSDAFQTTGTKSIETAYNVFMRTPEFFAGVLPKIAAIVFPGKEATLPFGIDAGRLSGAGGQEGTDKLQTWGQDYLDQWAKADAASGINPQKSVDIYNPKSLYHGVISAVQNVVFPSLAAADFGAGLQSAAADILKSTGYSQEALQSFRNLDIHPDEFTASHPAQARNLLLEQASQKAEAIVRGNEHMITGSLASGQKIPKSIIDELNGISNDVNTIQRERFGFPAKEAPIAAKPDAAGSYSTPDRAPAPSKPILDVNSAELSPIGSQLRKIAEALTTPLSELGQAAPLRIGAEEAERLPGTKVREGQPHPVGASMQEFENVGGEYPEAKKSIQTFNEQGSGSDIEHTPESRFKTPDDLINFVQQNGSGLGARLNKLEIMQLLQHLTSQGEDNKTIQTWGGKAERGTVYKSYGGGTDVVLGKIKDPRFGGESMIVAQINKAGNLDGRFRIHATPIEPGKIITKLGDSGLMQLGSGKPENPINETAKETPEKNQAKIQQTYRQLNRAQESLDSTRSNPEAHAKAYPDKPPAFYEAQIEGYKAKLKDLGAKTAPAAVPEEVHDLTVSSAESGAGSRALNKDAANQAAKAPSAAEKKLGDLMSQKAVLQETIANDPARELVKHISPTTGRLPEVTGNSGSIFGQTGDQKADQLGFKDVGEAQDRLDLYKKSLARLRELNGKIADQRSAVAEEKEAEAGDRSYNRLLDKTARETDSDIKKEERRKAIAKATVEADRLMKDRRAYADKLAKNAKDAIEEGNPKEGIIKGIMRDLNPVKHMRPSTKGIVENWLVKRNMANIVAKEVERKYAAHKSDGLSTIISQQDGAKIPYITAFFDAEITDANSRGLDVGYQDNYMPQVWRQTPEEIRSIMTARMAAQGLSNAEIRDYLDQKEELDAPTAARLKLNPFFTKDKIVPDYRTGIEMGLTPKYPNVVNLMAHYAHQKEIAIANRNLGQDLKENGDIRQATLDEPPRGWEKTQIFGRTYWAPKPLAEFLNDFLRNNDDLSWQQKIARLAATTSHFVQNIGLMAGIPFTTIQAFPISMLYTEILGFGNFKAIKPWLIANSTKASAQWVEKNWDTIRKMAEDGVPVDALAQGDWNREKVSELFRKTNMLNMQEVSKLFGAAYNKAWQTNTYDRMMPMLSVELYKDIYRRQLLAGASDAQARKIAAGSVKNRYVFREPQGRTTQDVMRSLWYGPVWREQVMKMLFNTVKAGYWKNWKDQTYGENRKLIAGALLTFAAYQIINHKNTGHYTWQNATGHELDIDFPQSDGSHIYATFFPSFATVPRAIVGIASAASQADFGTVGSQFAKLLNPNLQNLYSIFSNQNYFGQPITKPTDTPAQRLQKDALYIGGQTFVPSIVKSAVDYGTGSDTSIQALIGLTNGIVKYQSGQSAGNSAYFDQVAKAANVKAATVRAFQPTYDSIRGIMKAGDTQKATALYKALSDSDKAIYDSMKKSELAKDKLARERNIFPIVQKGRSLMTSGKTAEAHALYNSLSPDDKKAYDAVKKKFFSSSI